MLPPALLIETIFLYFRRHFYRVNALAYSLFNVAYPPEEADAAVHASREAGLPSPLRNKMIIGAFKR